MNIYEKVQEMRVALQTMNIKKSGENKFAGYKYYELGDFMPAINQLMKDYKVCSVVTFGAEEATLTLFNAEQPEEKVVFNSPMKDAVLKGAHPIQNLGAVETYQRRYLYMTAFEIVEADVLDATQNPNNQQERPQGHQKHNNPRNKQNGGQRPAKPPVQQAKRNTNLPDDIGEQLNAQIKMAKKVTGMSVQEVIAEAEKRTGIKMSDVTVETSQNILDALDDIMGAQIPL